MFLYLTQTNNTHTTNNANKREKLSTNEIYNKNQENQQISVDEKLVIMMKINISFNNTLPYLIQNWFLYMWGYIKV